MYWVLVDEKDLNPERKAVVEFSAGIDEAARRLPRRDYLSVFTQMREDEVGIWLPTEVELPPQQNTGAAWAPQVAGITNRLPPQIIAALAASVTDPVEIHMFQSTLGGEEGCRRERELLDGLVLPVPEE